MNYKTLTFLSLSISRYFGSVNFSEGRFPGSKAAYFSKPGSYAILPNINVTDFNFTIACWIKRSTRIVESYHEYIVWSTSGKPFNLVLTYYPVLRKYSVMLLRKLSINNPIIHFKAANTRPFGNLNEWNHLAVTCEQEKIRMFVNGKGKKTYAFFLQSSGYDSYTYISRQKSSYYHIGNYPLNNDTSSRPFYGSIMDLSVYGIALTEEENFNLFTRGKILLLKHFVYTCHSK